MARSNKSRATVICRQRNQVLLVRKAKAKWALPGGSIEAHEGPVEAAHRELCEETGLACETLRFLAQHEFSGRAHHVFFTHVPDSQDARPLNEIADCQWFHLEALSRLVVKKSSRELLERYGLFVDEAPPQVMVCGMADTPWSRMAFGSSVC